MNSNFLEKLKAFEPKLDFPLKKFTTWQIGGPAEFLVESKDSETLEALIFLANEFSIPITILGNGSNILISDKGIKGLVIINKSKNITILNDVLDVVENKYISHRHSDTKDEKYYSFSDLDYDEKGSGALVKFDSGVMLPFAINWILKNKLTGLQWFAGIPGSIGGSLYNNIHGGTKHFSDNFYSAEIIDQNNEKKVVDFDFFNFGYDQSILRKNPKIRILTVTLKLLYGDLEKAKYTSKEWLKRKSIQPKISCGSVFQALLSDVQKSLDFPTPSIGYIVDTVLGWKGKQIGDIQISPVHANFMVNIGQAKASDTLELIKQVRFAIKQKLGITIYPEINFLGFEQQELEGVFND
jgi:UDP-N-acetylmuramate dehydrogenase